MTLDAEMKCLHGLGLGTSSKQAEPITPDEEALLWTRGQFGKKTQQYIINPRRACAARVTVVVMSVCLSVRYTSGASFRLENAVTYSAGNEGQKICGVFSETAPLQRSSIPSNDGNTYRRPFFVRKACMRIIVFLIIVAAYLYSTRLCTACVSVLHVYFS